MLDSNGFKRPQYSDLITDMEAEARSKYGENVNTSERSFLGIILRIFAWFLSLKWQDTEDVYYSAYKNTAEGNNLERLGPYVGISKNQEQRSTGTVLINGAPDYTVLAGFRVATATEIFFETNEDVILDGTGTGIADVVAVNAGRIGNVAANTITSIINPDANITAVTNPAATSGGREKETDTEFRDRWDLSVAGGGAATLDSIRGALLRTSGVRAAVVIENNTNATDLAGRPAKSFEAYVLGGSAADIGQTILDTKAAGIEPYGSQSVTVNDLSGNPHTMKFSYAIEVPIHVRATIKTSASYPSNGDLQVESAIVRYIGGEDSDGQLYVGLNMGDDVIHSRLIASVYKVPGIEDLSLELSLDGSTWSQSNVDIDPQEVAQTTHTIITVVHSP